MKLRRYIQIEDRRVAAYEKKYAAAVYKALRQQVKTFLETNVFDERPMAEALKSMYMTVGKDYLSRQYEHLQRNIIEKKKRFFISIWEFWLEEQTRKLGAKITGINDTTHQQLKDASAKAVQEGMVSGATFTQIQEEIQRRSMAVISPYRARMIARTEVGAAIAESKTHSAEDWQRETGMQLGKLWIHRGAKDPRDWHMSLDNGVPIPKDQPWIVTNPNTGETDAMMTPHDVSASAGNVVNCSCQVIYVRLK